MGPRREYISPTPVRPRDRTSSLLTDSVKQMVIDKSSLSKVVQGRSIKQSMKIDVIDEEQTVSVTASESSSKGSNHSQNPLLDIMGAVCMGYIPLYLIKCTIEYFSQRQKVCGFSDGGHYDP